ncbi:PorV/PorQ family protein [candidate division KSB1 bacterium]|nr:PorV/PorQ family protein [candidate division KSB1 bacterium]
MKRLVIILALFCIAATAEAQDRDVSKVGITAAPFLEIGVGARAIGMGGAFVGTADDASALFWNTAGIARLKRRELFFMHAEWLAEIDFDYAAAVVPLGNAGVLGLSLTALNTGDMAVRTEAQPEGTGEIFSATDLCFGLSYALSLTDRFSIGLSGKYIHQKIWHETAAGFALDLGTLFVTGFHGLRIGAALSNFGTDMRMQGKDILVFHDIDPYILGNNDRVPAHLETETWPLPLIFQFGLAVEAWQNPLNRLTLAADAIHPYDNTESINLGLEYAFRELAFVRAGYRDLLLRDAEQGLTFGAGLATRVVGSFNLRIDYAYADFGRLQHVQRFSLALLF